MPESHRLYSTPRIYTASEIKIVTTPHLVLGCGFPGSGKTVLGEEIHRGYMAGEHNVAALDIDRFRNPRLAHNNDAQLDEAYAHMQLHAQKLVTEGDSAIIFATLRKREYREQQRDFAKFLGVPTLSFALGISLEERIRRVNTRDHLSISPVRSEEALLKVMEGMEPFTDVDFELNGEDDVNKLKVQIFAAQHRFGLIQELKLAV